jgi:asparagine synthase (glutamine-hydrolysing)
MLPRDRVGLLGIADHAYRGFSGRDVFWGGAIAYWEMQKRLVLRQTTPHPKGWHAYGLRPDTFEERDSAVIVRELTRSLVERGCEAAVHTRMLVTELGQRLPELLLMRIDKMTMAHGLEARVPFLSHHLVEYVLGLEKEQILPGGVLKGLLKDAVADLLPPGVLAQRKRGFAAPMASWLRTAAGERMERRTLASRLADEAGIDRAFISRTFAAHRTGRRDHSLHLWPLINAALWYDQWLADSR